MPFKETEFGQTHHADDGCIPPHCPKCLHDMTDMTPPLEEGIHYTLFVCKKCGLNLSSG